MMGAPPSAKYKQILGDTLCLPKGREADKPWGGLGETEETTHRQESIVLGPVLFILNCQQPKPRSRDLSHKEGLEETFIERICQVRVWPAQAHLGHKAATWWQLCAGPSGVKGFKLANRLGSLLEIPLYLKGQARKRLFVSLGSNPTEIAITTMQKLTHPFSFLNLYQFYAIK